MAKAKSKSTIIKLISSAATGYSRHVTVNRGAPLVKEVRYDPVAERHVLFTEAKKRKIAERRPLDFLRTNK